MMRSFTFLCALMAGLSGLYLYSEKHKTTLLDQQISQIVADTQHVREQTAMMRAEWALLNQPDRLASLSKHFLPGMRPMAPTQFIQMASLADRLPAPGSRPLAAINARAAMGAGIDAAMDAKAAPSDAPTGTATPAPAAPAPALASVLAAAPHPRTPAGEPIRLAAAHRPVPDESYPVAEHPDRPIMMADAAPPPVQLVAQTASPTAPPTVSPHFGRPAPVSPDLTRSPERRAVLSVAHVARPVLPPAAATVTRIAAYRPVRPVPMTVAAWRPAIPASYQEARGYGRGSSLGFTHSASLPPPVPVSN
jgi:hypothetical protein